MRVALALAIALALTLTLATTSIAHAQNPPATVPHSNAVQIFTSKDIAAKGDSLPAGASAFKWLVQWDGLATMVSRRDSSGIPERHEQFGDVFVVQRGHARLLTGGTTDGERSVSPGEWRGGTIRGGTEAELSPGDIVVIPPGIPHQVLLPPGERFHYFVFKITKSAQK
jgi:mannose-6-phosphate isomerase-like protein (cupin superfamily)